MKITSVNNDLVKETAKLLKNKHREESKLFLIEGEKGIKEALSSGLDLIRIFVSEGTEFDFNGEIIETNEAVLSKISDAKSAPKAVAVAKQAVYTKETLNNASKVVLLEGVKDAGNLGTIIRTAVAFGTDALVLYGDTVDLYNPKTVRSAVGNLWKIPIFVIKDFNELSNIFANWERVATLPKGDNVLNLSDYIPSKKALIMFGSEADGLSSELKEFATKNVTIEMAPKVESLNLSISAGVFLYRLREN